MALIIRMLAKEPEKKNKSHLFTSVQPDSFVYLDSIVGDVGRRGA
jgi:hypothetical protein